MATLKYRIRRKNATGTFDVIHIETSPELITSGVLGAGVLAASGTDYTAARLRNIQASTIDLVAGTSELANGTLYVVYSES